MGRPRQSEVVCFVNDFCIHFSHIRYLRRFDEGNRIHIWQCGSDEPLRFNDTDDAKKIWDWYCRYLKRNNIGMERKMEN